MGDAALRFCFLQLNIPQYKQKRQPVLAGLQRWKDGVDWREWRFEVAPPQHLAPLE
jgi:hypothetical protein